MMNNVPTVTMYKSKDGSVYSDPQEAIKHNFEVDLAEKLEVFLEQARYEHPRTRSIALKNITAWEKFKEGIIDGE